MSFASEHLEEIALAEIREDYPLADAYVLESLASCAHDAAVPDPTPEDLAIAARCTLVVRGDWPIEGSLLRARVIVVRAQRRRRMTIAILHELAHALLLRAGIAHSHGDVWCLTLALAAPRGLLCGMRGASATDLARRFNVPTWMLRERLAMPAVQIAS